MIARSRGSDRRVLARVAAFAVMAIALTAGVDAAGDLRLIEAVRAKNAERVRALIAERVDVNARQGDQATALHWAAHLDDKVIVDELLRAGAVPDVADDTGATPLYLACVNGNAEVVARLLDAGASAKTMLLSGETALMTCARSGNATAVRSLLRRGAPVNIVNARESAHDQTALMWAAAESHPDVVAALLEGGADVSARSREYTQTVTSEVTQRAGREALNYTVPRGGSTALLFAARSGDAESARLLVAAGADVNDALPDGSSALILAAYSGHTRAAEMLLDKGADANADAVGYTALHAAVLRSDLALVKALLAHGASPNASITKGTPVRRNSEDFELPKTLMGATPYLLAAKFLEADIMRALAAGGADTRMRMKDGATPLMAAAGMGIVPPAQDEKRGTDRRGLAILDGGIVEPESRVLEAVTTALTLGSDIDATNPSGETALHIASAQGYDTVVSALAERGANLNARNAKGQTPLGALVERKSRPRTIELLRKLGAGI
jgi:ankyrin repeat protein